MASFMPVEISSSVELTSLSLIESHVCFPLTIPALLEKETAHSLRISGVSGKCGDVKKERNSFLG